MTHTVIALVSGVKYLFRIRALNDIGASDYSDEVTIAADSLPNPPSSMIKIDYKSSLTSIYV
jgi:hypothetical protein